MDKLIDIAQVIVNNSLKVRKGDRVLVQGEDIFSDFGEMVAKCAESKGATIFRDYFSLSHRRELMLTSDLESVEQEAARLVSLYEAVNKRCLIDGVSDPDFALDVSHQGVSQYFDRVWYPFVARVWGDSPYIGLEKKVSFEYPLPADARIGMSLKEYEDLVFDASLVDWSLHEKNMQRTADYLSNKTIRVVVPELTDLTFSLHGRGAFICTGQLNLPDGEFFFCPLEYSANGHITFPFENFYRGKKFGRVRLDLQDGRVEDFETQFNQDFFAEYMKDEGSRRFGEFGVGWNPKMTQPVGHYGLDEKISRTIHFALGESFPRSLTNGGGLNLLAKIHWDLVSDLRKTESNPGGYVFADGTKVNELGTWLV